jgi:hypothetical protein
MKKKLPPAELPLPKFQSDEEAADYFDTHSVANIFDQLSPVPKLMLTRALDSKVRERHDQAKREHAGASIRKLRKGNILGPALTIRDLTEEGRRF